MQGHHHTRVVATSRPDLSTMPNQYMNSNNNYNGQVQMIQDQRRGGIMTMPNTPMHNVKHNTQYGSMNNIHLPPIHHNTQMYGNQMQDRRPKPIMTSIDEDLIGEHPKQLLNMVKSARNYQGDGMQGNNMKVSTKQLHNNYMSTEASSGTYDDDYTPVQRGMGRHHGSINAVSMRGFDRESFSELPSPYSPRIKTINVVQEVKRKYEEMNNEAQRAKHHHHSQSIGNYPHHQHRHHHPHHGHVIEDAEESSEESESSEEEVIIIRRSQLKEKDTKLKHLQRKDRPKRGKKVEEEEEEEEVVEEIRTKKKKDTKTKGKKEKTIKEEKKPAKEEKKPSKEEKKQMEAQKKAQENINKEKKKSAHHKLVACLWALAIPAFEISFIRTQVKRVRIHRKFLNGKIDDAISEIEEYCNHQASKELQHMFKDVKQPFIFVSGKTPVTESKIAVQAEALEHEIHQIFDKLASNSHRFSDNFYQTLGEFTENDSVVPVNYLTECELKRLPLTKYATLDNPMEWTTKLLILGLIIRGFIFRVLFKGPYSKDAGKAFNIASIIYVGAMDLLKSNTPVYAKNQKSVFAELKLTPKEPEKNSQAVHVFENEDAKNEILLGFLGKIELGPVQKIKRSLFEAIKVGFGGWLEKIYQISHNRWQSQAHPHKREKREKKMKDF